MVRLSPRLGPILRACVAVCLTLVGARTARAGESTIPEPVVEENITDVDASRVGTVEVDFTGSMLAPRAAPKTGSWSSELEAEWRPVDRLGLGAGVAWGGSTSGFSPTSAGAVVPRVAASYVFVRDRPRHLYFQWEASARAVNREAAALDDPLEATLPYTAGVRWATQAGPFTLRAGLIGEAGGSFAHAPIRQSYGALLQCFDLGSRLYLGAELVEDWARASPLLVVPEVLLLSRLLGAPVRLGIGVPSTLGARDRSEAGIAVRFVLEPDE